MPSGPSGSFRPTMRASRNGIVPPACANTQRMLGYRAAMPLSSRLTIVRVVCVPYSIDDWLGMPGTRFSQQGASCGCVKTTALRRFSSS